MALTTDLPETGGRPRDMLVVVALLLAAGLGMIAAARRRTPAHPVTPAHRAEDM